MVNTLSANALNNKSSVRKKRRFSSEFAAVLYFWIYQIIQPIIWLSIVDSKIVVFVALLIGIIMVVVQCGTRFSYKHIAIIAFIALLLLFDSIFRRNVWTVEYLEHFVMYALLPFLLMSKVNNYKKFLRYFCGSCVIGFIYFVIIRVFNLTHIYGDYMDLGFGLLLPSYLGLAVARLFYRKKFYILFEIPCFVCILLFANRSCLLSILFFWLIYCLSISKNRKAYRKVFIVLLFVVVCISLNIKKIVIFLDEKVFERYDLVYRPWYYIKQLVFNNDVDRFTSGRVSIWSEAWTLFKANPLFGYGTGYFDTVSTVQNYPHNIVLELFLQWGVLTCILIILFIGKSFKTFKLYKKQHNAAALFIFILLLSLCFPKLLLSNTYMKEMALWMLLSFILLKQKNRTGEKKK